MVNNSTEAVQGQRRVEVFEQYFKFNTFCVVLSKCSDKKGISLLLPFRLV